MVRGPFHRPGRRDQCREPWRWPQGGVRQLALGADEESSQSDRSVQAAGLRARGEGIFQARGQLARIVASFRGAKETSEPGISRFRVWSFGPSRNDGEINLACDIVRPETAAKTVIPGRE